LLNSIHIGSKFYRWQNRYDAREARSHMLSSAKPGQVARTPLASIRKAVLIALALSGGAAICREFSSPGTVPTASVERDLSQANLEIQHFYAKYLSSGRSDVEIHFSAAGDESGAQTRVNHDGSFDCRVFGLSNAAGASSPLLRAGLFVHEATHCQIDPYAPDLVLAINSFVSEVHNDLVLLTVESVADARAVIEVFRKDGASAARQFAHAMLPRRQQPADFSHSTSLALVQALETVESSPETVKSDEQAFGRAVSIGLSAARSTLRDSLAAKDQTAVPDSSAFNKMSMELAAAMAGAVRAFHAGRYVNNAATIRRFPGFASEGDYHFFVSEGRTIRTEPCISAEGAHRVHALKALMGSSVAPEHSLAIRWLRQQGLLNTFRLNVVRNAFAYLIKNHGEGSPEKTARAVAASEHAIREAQPGEDLETTLERAEQSFAHNR
jgi:hypothetical protein